ncbi:MULTISPECIES: hemolysin family protein [unclassified Clostridium]|uniref:hemolysin family protein n=1 Tax=unclassified Clostridium TaxID=2614128 RepID=UPI001A9ACF58|nr:MULTISPECIES: hemolysin family protein [unclassified Clostridium]
MSPDPIWSQLLLQVVLIALNAFFAATEIAVISLNENKLRHQAEQGDKKAKQMLRMVQTPAGFLSTIQIGITLAGFLASAFAAENFSDKLVQFLVKDCGFTVLPEQTLDVISIIVITLILSYFTLVLGELVPKRVAMKRSEKVARAASGVIHFLSVVMKPIVWLLSVSTNGVLRLMRIDPAEKEEAVTEEEIRLMVDIGQERGTIAADEREMIDNIFEFNNTTAEEIMVHRTDMSVIGLDDTPEDILALIEETGLSRFPVYGEDIDDIRGIVSTRQFLLNQRHENPLPLSKIMRPAYFVPESVRADILFREMQKTKTHLAIVVDEYGGTSGLVTMEDLLEEIVGNIYDEFDPQDVQELQPLAENLWRVSGGIDLETLGEALEMELPTEEEYDTLGGLVFSQLTAIPEDGSRVTVEVAGLHIEVEELIEHRVEWALVSKLPPQTPPEESESEH